MIARFWRGWTKPESADIYESLLLTEIFPALMAKGDSSPIHIDLFRRQHEDEAEFTTVLWFSGPDNVKALLGEDFEAAYVPDSARAILSRFEDRASHFEHRAARDREWFESDISNP